MNMPSPTDLPSPAPRDPLADAYHAAASAHAATLRSGSKLEILTAFRAVIVAEIALLRDSGGALDRATADAAEWELADLDRDLMILEAQQAATNVGPLVAIA